jgi:hypothetical protein
MGVAAHLRLPPNPPQPVAAKVRPNPEILTDKHPPLPPHIVTRGWPPASMELALLAVAQDPESRSPARVAEAGPWWDTQIRFVLTCAQDLQSLSGSAWMVM